MNIKNLGVMSLLIFTFYSTPSFSDESEATHMLNGNTEYSPIDESQVAIYTYKPNFKFEIIGTIEARGMAQPGLTSLLNFSYPGEKEDLKLAVKALKAEAASIGANGVIIAKSRQVSVSSEATERRISAIAIRY